MSDSSPPSRPPLGQQTSVSRSSSFSRAASFQFTPRQQGVPSPLESPFPSSNPTSPILGPTPIINHNVPTPTLGHLSRHGSLSSNRSRPSSVVPSPIQSPREEHKGTWYVFFTLKSEREGENIEHPTFDEWFRPYSTANSSTSSLSSQVTAGGTHKPSERTLKEIESKEISFGMSAGSTSTQLLLPPFSLRKWTEFRADERVR